MKILFDIVHPTGVHAFKNVIYLVRSKGHETIVTLRDKDNAGYLLQKYGIDYIKTNNKTGKNFFTSFLELMKRMYYMVSIIKKEKPDILIGITNVNIAPLGFIFRIPVLDINDNQHAWLNQLISFTFDTRIITPESFKIKYSFWRRKQITYPGHYSLAYLHGKYFTPEKKLQKKLKLENKKNTLIRLVSLKAHHDAFLKGFSLNHIDKIINELKEYSNIFINSEYKLPEKYRRYAVPVTPERFLDFLSICDLYIGESATVASEACMLGVPSIYVSDSKRCYTDDLEYKYGVCRNFDLNEFDEALNYAKDILTSSKAPQHSFDFDVTKFIVELIEKYGKKE
ncbi:MAG: DUF354 domain-containing protein [Elusimicrobiota bacterium]